MTQCQLCGTKMRPNVKICVHEKTWSKTTTATCPKCGNKFRAVLRGRRKPGSALMAAVQVAKLGHEA